MNSRIDRQGGWVGMLVLLLALLIVAWLSKDALVKYGMMSDTETTVTRAGTPAERARASGGSAVERVDPTGAAPAPTNAIERARGVEETMKRGAESRGGAL
jgi:hypothetical protein